MAASTPEKRRAAQVVRALQRDYPDVTCELEYANPLQLLIATILSAQCTDQRVNIVTRTLFRKCPTAAALAAVPLPELEQEIHSTGFFRNKAKNIQTCCRQLVERYAGEVPADMDVLVELPGVGRKTANVVMGTAFRQATGVVVDTHVTRIARRLGMTREENAEKIERDLIAVLPKKEWIDFSHRMIHHGRRICQARKPLCAECRMLSFCPRIDLVT
ncbi:MAG: endonuclease III [Pirellulaceae bacterium]